MSNQLHRQRTLRPRQSAKVGARAGVDGSDSNHGLGLLLKDSGGVGSPESDIDGAQTGSRSAGRRRARRDTIGSGRVPAAALLLARPLLLGVCLLLGAVAGAVVTGRGGYQAQAVVEFSTSSNDSTLVKQTGQTLALTAVSQDVLTAAEKVLKEPAGALDGRVSALWQQDTDLVTVTVSSTIGADVIGEANAVAKAMVTLTNNDVASQLAASLAEFNQILNTQQLDSAPAEAARRSQLGAALAARQDAIAAGSGSVKVRDPAGSASVGGLSRPLGAAIGGGAGILLGGLISLLLGLRWLRVFSARTLRMLVPENDLSSPSQAAELAGQIIESGQNCLAVVVTKGVNEQGEVLARDVSAFLRAHGKRVLEVLPEEILDSKAALELLRYDRRMDVHASMNADMLVVVVPAGSVGCQLLEGQSNLRSLVVMRRRSTPVVDAMRTMQAMRRSEPVLVLAK